MEKKSAIASEVTLLLVEDDDVDAQGIKRAFKQQRISNPVVRAQDGIEALEILENEKVRAPYVILLDLNMPRMGGLEFLEALRRHEKLSDSVVFVLTTSDSDKDIVSSYKHHISGYFVKKEMGTTFFDVAKLFDGYWKMVKLPVE